MKLEITILLSFLLSVLTASIISQIGSKTALVDHPNYRSSHSLPTPRGGGIGIWLAFVILGVFFFKDNAFTLIAGIAGLIGFLEDIFTLSSKLRLLIQIIISAQFSKGKGFHGRCWQHIPRRRPDAGPSEPFVSVPE